MERTIRNLCVATGLFISATVAMLPLSSYAAPTSSTTGNGKTCWDTSGQSSTPVAVSCDKSIDVNLTVEPAIEINAFSGITESEAITLSPTEVKYGTFSATVTSNTGYTLSLSADPEIGASMVHATDKQPYIAPTNNLVGGTAGWAVNQATGHPTFSGLTTSLVEYYRSATIARNTTVQFGVGIAASGSLPQGIYQGTVVITAHAGNS